MTAAREIMTGGGECVGEMNPRTGHRKMKDLDVGSLPICGRTDNRLKGMLTDRGIVIKCLAEGGGPHLE